MAAVPFAGDNTTACAALRVLLCHLLPAPQRLLASVTCACRAWREEAARPEHHRVMLFDHEVAGAASLQLARVLERNAAHVEELRASFALDALVAMLSPAAAFSRLALVHEGGGVADDAALLSRPALLARARLLHAAPLLTRWRVGRGEANAVP